MSSPWRLAGVCLRVTIGEKEVKRARDKSDNSDVYASPLSVMHPSGPHTCKVVAAANRQAYVDAQDERHDV